MHNQWNDDNEDQEKILWYLDDATKVEIYVRDGHGLRVVLMKMREQRTFDFLRFGFYTRTPSGWLI
jgi:hypothetical protein